MNDQISRQKLIEELEMLYRNPVEDDETLEWNRAVYKAIEYVESQPPADQWIPCSERLPKESNEYEVTVVCDGLVYTLYSYYSMKESRWCTYPNNITAWRERLPEPYKGE